MDALRKAIEQRIKDLENETVECNDKLRDAHEQVEVIRARREVTESNKWKLAEVLRAVDAASSELDDQGDVK